MPTKLESLGTLQQLNSQCFDHLAMITCPHISYKCKYILLFTLSVINLNAASENISELIILAKRCGLIPIIIGSSMDNTCMYWFPSWHLILVFLKIVLFWNDLSLKLGATQGSGSNDMLNTLDHVSTLFKCILFSPRNEDKSMHSNGLSIYTLILVFIASSFLAVLQMWTTSHMGTKRIS